VNGNAGLFARQFKSAVLVQVTLETSIRGLYISRSLECWCLAEASAVDSCKHGNNTASDFSDDQQETKSHSQALPLNNPPKNLFPPALAVLPFFAVTRLFICSSFGFTRKLTAFLLPPAPFLMTSFS
jgi:hypothetical protein